MLKQTYKNYELIVIDDCSSDKTKDIIQKYTKHLKYEIKQFNKGPADSRNIGVEKSCYDTICFLDADDYWSPTKLEKQVSYLQKFPEINIFSNNVISVKNDKIIGKRFDKEKVFLKTGVNEGIVENYIRTSGRYAFHPPSAIMVKKKLFEKYGKFNVNLKSVEDSEIVLRWIINGEKIYYNDDPVVFYETANFSSLTKNIDLWCENHFKYWMEISTKKLSKNQKELFLKMKKSTLLQSLIVIIKRGEGNCARKYIILHFKELFSLKLILIFFFSLLPINIYLKIFRK